MTGNPDWQGFTNLQPEDIEVLLAIARTNDWLRAALHTLARRGVALRQQQPDRAFELLQLLSPHPFYKGGQFLFDLLEWEDFIVDGPPPAPVETVLDTSSVRALSGVLRGLKGYLDGALPRDMDFVASFDPTAFVDVDEDLPPLEPGFYLYQDIVLGLLRTVIHRRPLCLAIDPAQLGDDDSLGLPYRADGFELRSPTIERLPCRLDDQRQRVALLLPAGGELRVSLPAGARLVVADVRHTQRGTLIVRAYDSNGQLLAERALQPDDQPQEMVLELAAADIIFSSDTPAELLGICVYRFLGTG